MSKYIDEELVRCRPCGYVMKKSELDKIGVCPACGMPHTVFEPYRERVSANRLFILGLDIHPIAIHLSQTFVAMIPGLMILRFLFPNFLPDYFSPVIDFSIFVFPLSLIAAFASGIIDGLTRFKTLDTPLLKSKIYYGIVIFVISILMIISLVYLPEKFDIGNTKYSLIDLLLGISALFCAVKLGMMGKKLLDVILPGTYRLRKKKVQKKEEKH
ncbi:MAG: rubrerythrin [Porphyromonadaceae bacterium]|nr:rubrerythrin [Porphyromonadaceae bacterium]